MSEDQKFTMKPLPTIEAHSSKIRPCVGRSGYEYLELGEVVAECPEWVPEGRQQEFFKLALGYQERGFQDGEKYGRFAQAEEIRSGVRASLVSLTAAIEKAAEDLSSKK